MGDLSKWVMDLRPAADPNRIRLFCFPCAGGSASMYSGWAERLGDAVAVLPVELPGRGIRFRESPLRDMGALLSVLADTLEPLLSSPFALYGHSMGGVIAHELARGLQQDRGISPESVHVSAALPAWWRSGARPLHQLGDRELQAEMSRFDGTPQEVLDDGELMRLMLPVIRSDFELVEKHRSRPEPRLRCPLVAYAGISDTLVGADDQQSWREGVADTYDLERFPGGHFFIASHADLFLWRLRERLTSSRCPDARGVAHGIQA